MSNSMKRKSLGVVLLGMAISTGCFAVQVRGTQSCGQWVIDRKGAEQQNYTETWLLGYLSGLSVGVGKEFLLGTDNPSIFLWVDNYCHANPLSRLDAAGTSLAHELAKQKGL